MPTWVAHNKTTQKDAGGRIIQDGAISFGPTLQLDSPVGEKSTREWRCGRLVPGKVYWQKEEE